MVYLKVEVAYNESRQAYLITALEGPMLGKEIGSVEDILLERFKQTDAVVFGEVAATWGAVFNPDVDNDTVMHMTVGKLWPCMRVANCEACTHEGRYCTRAEMDSVAQHSG